MLTMGEMLARNAHLHPDQEAYVCGDQALTHSQFAERALRLANGLYRLGLRKQDRISVLSNNRMEYFEAFAAAECAGYILHTVNYKMSEAELAYVVGDAAPKVIVFEPGFAPQAESLRARFPEIRHFLCLGTGPGWAISYEGVVTEGSAGGPLPHPSFEDIAYLMYTSGTTGRPKGCMISHRAAYSFAAGVVRECGVNGGERMLLNTPMFYIGVKSFQAAQALMGATVILQNGFDAAAVARAIENQRVSFTFMVPTMLQAFLNLPGLDERDLSGLKTIVVSGAPVPVPLLKRGLERLGPVFIQQWGMTEGGGTALHKHQICPEGSPVDVRRLASCGQAHVGTELRIVNDAGEECPPDNAGEVVMQSATLFSGYWNNSVATLEAMRDGWFRTGDIGYLDEQGFLFLVDRKKDMIISGGENIYSKEVEDVLLQHDGVAEVAVIGVPDDYWGESVKAVVVAKRGATALAEDLIAHARARLAKYKCPKTVDFVDELPRVASGKVSKVALRARYKTNTINQA